jgi:hypothetical protein
MKRKRRTKAEMEAARATLAAAGVGFRDIFDVLEEAPKPKNRTAPKPKKRTRKSKVKIVEEKYDIPKNNTVYLDRPAKTGEKVICKYPTPKPMPKFDGEIYDTIEFSAGSIYAKARGSSKNAGFHIMCWNSIDKDWKMLYNGIYQKPEDQNRHWASFERMHDELKKDKPKNDKGMGSNDTRRKKTNGRKRGAQ